MDRVLNVARTIYRGYMAMATTSSARLLAAVVLTAVLSVTQLPPHGVFTLIFFVTIAVAGVRTYRFGRKIEREDSGT